jgi:hypothetical protein
MKTIWYVVAAILGIVTALIATNLKADDVYNFYFQKAPGPSTVYQSGGATPTVNQNGTPAPGVAPTADGQTLAKVDGAKTEDDKSFSHWEIFLGKNSFSPGITEFGDENGGASPSNGEWILGFQYNFSKTFGLGLQILQPSGQSIVFTGPMSTLDYTGEIVFTPFHMNVASFDVMDFGFTGGFTTVSTGYNVPYNGDPYSGGGYYSPSTNTHGHSYFLGALAALNIGKSFAIVGEVDELPEQKVSRLTLGVKFKL